MAWAMILPISESWLAEQVPTWAISLEESTFLDIFLEAIDDGTAPVDATADLGVSAAVMTFEALGVDGLGVDGGGGGAVAGVLGGLLATP